MEKPWPAAADQAIEDMGADRAAVAGDALYDAVGFEAPPGGIEYDEVALPRRVVMAADNGYDLCRMTGTGRAKNIAVGQKELLP